MLGVWLGLLRGFAERWNPGFGQVEYAFDSDGTTGLEASWSPRLVPLEQRDAGFTIGRCREFLRGYSWVTVVPEELAGRVGGVQGLRASGAFVEVAPLAAGGVWLLATRDYRDYGSEQVGRVFRALAPVLPAGLPELRVTEGKPAPRVVLEDAAVVAANARADREQQEP